MHRHLPRGRIVGLIVLLTLLLPSLSAPQPTRAADPIYFPETGHYLGGAFRDFWERNGGLYVFGYPISEEYFAENGRLTQWFERARFEYFPEHAGTPYVVQLGLLGIEFTGGRIFPQIPPRPNDANHRYFPETQHMIMWGFKTIWEQYGGLQIFGYPISEEIMEVLPADGEWHVVQYFERARFEYWPNFPPGKRVLISDLGRQLAPPHLTAPLPPGAPPGTAPAPLPPEPAPITAPPNVDATVTPSSGPPGTIFLFNAFGFQPGELVSIWATAPDQAVYPADFQVVADPDGSLTSSEIYFASDEELPTGVWAITAQGISSGKASIGYFVLTGPPPPPPPPSSLPPPKNASVQPWEGPPGTTFYFFANGFEANETVLVGAYNSSGQLVSDMLAVLADGGGSIDYAGVYFHTFAETPPDIYKIYAVGERSKRDAYAYLRVTPAVTTLAPLRAAGPSARPLQLQPGLHSRLEQ